MSDRLVLPDFKLETYFSKWEFTAQHHLTASDAQTMSIDELLDMGSEADRQGFADLQLGYTPTWGTEELRQAVADSYRSPDTEALDAHHVLGFAGAGEALFWAMQLFVEPGDHVIVTVPNYQTIESLPIATGISVDGLPLWTGQGADLQWTLDLDRFESMLRPETRLVSVNFPNNPTGFVPDHATWLAFNQLCHDRGIRVVSDEVYRGIEMDPARTLAAATEINPSALSISVTSKAYGLPGLRVGWIASRDTAALAQLERAKHYTSICNAGPSEYLTVIALRNSDKILDRNRAIVTENNRAVVEFMGRHGDLFDYQPPDGGCVCFPRYVAGDVNEFCTRAVEQDGVFLLPTSVYKSALADVPFDRFRIGLGRTNMMECLEALDAHLAR